MSIVGLNEKLIRTCMHGDFRPTYVWYMLMTLLLTHTVHSVQMILHICDKFAIGGGEGTHNFGTFLSDRGNLTITLVVAG